MVRDGDQRPVWPRGGRARRLSRGGWHEENGTRQHAMA
jgi:hypothetical protein